MSRALRGDPVLDQLLAEELPRLRAFVRAHLSPELRQRESSSDLVQSVCRSLLAAKQRFEFRGESQFRAWLFLAARHKIADKARFHERDQRVVRRVNHVDEGAASAVLAAYQTVTTPSHVAVANEQLEQLERAIDLLEPDYREVVTLIRVAGLSFEDAAVVMQRTPTAVRALLGRALIKLGGALRQVGFGALEPPK